MENISKNRLIIIGILVSVLVGFSSSITPVSASGNFDSDANLDYYPETLLTLNLQNLTSGQMYGILIGANQASINQAWNNFTATGTTETRIFSHFKTQAYIDNFSQVINILRIELYNITSNSDTSPVLIDQINYNLVTIKQQLDPYFWGMLLFVVLSSIVLMNILRVIVKGIWK